MPAVPVRENVTITLNMADSDFQGEGALTKISESMPCSVASKLNKLYKSVKPQFPSWCVEIVELVCIVNGKMYLMVL